MEKYELQRLRDLPIEGVASRMGLAVSRHKCLCPFHDDHHASLSFSVRRNTFRCFVCGAHGGPIDLAMRHLGLGFVDACRWLADEHQVIASSFKMQDSGGPTPKPFDASRYERFFERPWLNEAARRFLFQERRLDPRVVAWCRLTSWRDRQGVSWLQIPYYSQDGRLTGVQNRNLTTPSKPPRGEAYEPQSPSEAPSPSKPTRGEACEPQSPSEAPTSSKPPRGEACEPHSPSGEMEGGRSLPRFRFPAGSVCGIYNLPVLRRLRPGDELWITEGASDCWAMLSAGRKAIAIPSATLLGYRDAELLTGLCREATVSFHMAPDRDAPGERLFLQLQQALPGLQHHQLPPDCKDFAEYYVKHHVSGFKIQDYG